MRVLVVFYGISSVERKQTLKYFNAEFIISICLLFHLCICMYIYMDLPGFKIVGKTQPDFALPVSHLLAYSYDLTRENASLVVRFVR